MTESTAQSTTGPWEPLTPSSVTLLTTYRRNGTAVATPVGRIINGDRLFFTTRTRAYKTKRLARDPRVTMAPCTRVGEPTGPSVEGVARPVGSDVVIHKTTGERIQEFMWTAVYKLRYRDVPITYEVFPADADEAGDADATVRTSHSATDPSSTDDANPEGSTTMPDKDADRTEIVNQLRAMADAWKKGDGAGYAAPFTDDADYISFDGNHVDSKQVIGDVHQMLFDGPLKGSTMDDIAHATPKVKFLTDDTAILISTGGTSFGESAATDSDRASIVTLTAVRTGEGWRFASFQNTRRQAHAHG